MLTSSELYLSAVVGKPAHFCVAVNVDEAERKQPDDSLVVAAVGVIVADTFVSVFRRLRLHVGRSVAVRLRISVIVADFWIIIAKHQETAWHQNDIHDRAGSWMAWAGMQYRLFPGRLQTKQSLLFHTANSDHKECIIIWKLYNSAITYRVIFNSEGLTQSC